MSFEELTDYTPQDGSGSIGHRDVMAFSKEASNDWLDQIYSPHPGAFALSIQNALEGSPLEDLIDRFNCPLPMPENNHIQSVFKIENKFIRSFKLGAAYVYLALALEAQKNSNPMPDIYDEWTSDSFNAQMAMRMVRDKISAEEHFEKRASEMIEQGGTVLNSLNEFVTTFISMDPLRRDAALYGGVFVHDLLVQAEFVDTVVNYGYRPQSQN